MGKLIAVAISGGVDSLVSASLLKKQGYALLGIHFINGDEKKSYSKITSEIDNIAKQLDIPITIINCQKEFKANIIDYFTMTYKAGMTPNPCLVCNVAIKFGTVLDFAKKAGADYLATGHYARVKLGKDGIFHLFKGIDHTKDQSYFLAFLNQQQLKAVCFPLGEMRKSDVRALSASDGLIPVSNVESQDICFIDDKSYNDFLLGQPNFISSPGNIVDVNGNILGKHNGLHLFTIGQRKGINCPGKEPYYVLKLDRYDKTVIVGSKKKLFVDRCRIKNINWIGTKPTSPIKLFVKIRYRHTEVSSIIHYKDDKTGVITFETPQSSVTPGQAAVFYNGDELIGGGWIE